jgi:DNA-binding NarL/FixJ family response regulator
MLTSFSDDEALLGAVMAGAPATCSRTSAAATSSARSAPSPPGGSLLDARSTAHVLARLREKPTDPLDVLTEQERRILDLIGRG